MKKYWMVAGAALLVTAGVLWYLGQAPKHIVVRQVAGPPQPRVPFTEAGFDPSALAAAEAYLAARNSTALVVGRGGHIVYEKYWGGTHADTVIETGFDPVLVPLALGALVNDRVIPGIDLPATIYLGAGGADAPPARTLRQLLADEDPAHLPANVALLVQAMEKAAGKRYETIVAEEIWAPIEAGDVAFAAVARGPHAGGVDPLCCLRARLGDWMRIGEALSNDGVFLGNQITPPRFVAEMLSPARPDSPRGYLTRLDGSFAAHDTAWLEGRDHQRMWIVPSLRLVILRTGGPAGDKGWDELMVPNTIIRGTSGWAPRRVEEGVDPSKYAPH